MRLARRTRSVKIGGGLGQDDQVPEIASKAISLPISRIAGEGEKRDPRGFISQPPSFIVSRVGAS
jgi:hypothetical protein